jgi:hypothetical protein
MKIPVFHQVLQDHMGETYQVDEREYQVGLTTWPILITYLRGQKKLALMFWCHSANFKKTRMEIWLEGIQIADVADTKEIQGELKGILEDDLPQLAKLILG